MIVALDYKNPASFPGVQLGPLHYRNLEINKNIALREHKGDFDAMMRISKQSYTELQWWVTNVHTAYKPISTPPIDITIYSDVSLEGWGGKDSTKQEKRDGNVSLSISMPSFHFLVHLLY